jgi:hypothetical protein
LEASRFTLVLGVVCYYFLYTQLLYPYAQIYHTFVTLFVLSTKTPQRELIPFLTRFGLYLNMKKTPTKNNPSNTRLYAKNFILTFPKLPDFSYQDVISRLQKHKFSSLLTFYAISKDSHQDGDLHAHVFLHYHKRVQINKLSFFDFLFNKHGHYLAARKPRQAYEYVVKHSDFVEHGKNPFRISMSVRETIRKSIRRDKHTPGDYFRFIESEEEHDVVYNDAYKIESYTKK